MQQNRGPVRPRPRHVVLRCFPGEMLAFYPGSDNGGSIAENFYSDDGAEYGGTDYAGDTDHTTYVVQVPHAG